MVHSQAVGFSRQYLTPVRRLHPPILAEAITARLQAREQRRGNKAREVCMANQRRRNAGAARERRKREVQQAPDDEGSTL